MSKFQVTRETETDKVEGTLLGQRVAAPTTYTPEILVAIPRSENRGQYGINDKLFVGEDHWYAYECSTMTSQGVPVYFGMVIMVPSDSPFIVESKSLKLYLNSFNMERSRFPDTYNAKNDFIRTVEKDLRNLLDSPELRAHEFNDYSQCGNFDDLTQNEGFVDLESIVDYSQLECVDFNETPELLQTSPLREHKRLRVYFNGFRSNCKVTHQPDYATVFIDMHSQAGCDPASLVAYLTSFRNESHFHEECVEAIFKRLTDAFAPKDLFVRANYTRRGGIDINPSRYSIVEPARTTIASSALAPGFGTNRRYNYHMSMTKYQ